MGCPLRLDAPPQITRPRRSAPRRAFRGLQGVHSALERIETAHHRLGCQREEEKKQELEKEVHEEAQNSQIEEEKEEEQKEEEKPHKTTVEPKAENKTTSKVDKRKRIKVEKKEPNKD